MARNQRVFEGANGESVGLYYYPAPQQGCTAGVQRSGNAASITNRSWLGRHVHEVLDKQ